MKPRYSNGLMLVWQVANLEAKHLQAAFIEPAHLLLGLCKCVDIDLPVLIPSSVANREILLEELLREFRQLRDVFKSSSFDPMKFRRHYRTVLPKGSNGINSTAGQLHRNDAAKDAFAEAEKVAAVSGGVVYPMHLLYVLLLEPDTQREKAMSAVGLNEARLLHVTKQHLFKQKDMASPVSDWPNIQWN